MPLLYYRGSGRFYLLFLFRILQGFLYCGIEQGFLSHILSFYKKGREMTLKNAYGWLIGHYYTTYTETGRSRVAPAFERPTYRQFTYYCHKNLTKTEKDIIKLGKAEQRNAKRLLLGSSRTDALRPGWIVEADALEVDCSIISELNPEQCIGRPILYMMIDVYSSAIVAFSVSLENNSMLGLTNLMLNLADNKVDLCQQYNINIQENLWPSGFIPHEIRCDRGSDFKSDIFANICNHLNITRTLESGGTGSMKGLVEQSFHQFQTQMRPHLENKGLITKRHDSNHHRTAMLNLREFTQMVINFIVTHNTKAMSNYPVQKEMYRIPNFIPTPINLWKFGCDTKGCPTMITDAIKDQYIYNLMIERSAKISRRGLEFMGLYYWNANDPDLGEQIYKLGTKTQKITIRFDPRCMGKIYYLRDNKLFCAELNSARRETEGFADMTYIEYVEYHNMRREMRRRGNDLNTEIDLYRFKNNELIVASAEKPNLSDTKRLREARAKEKQFINTQNTLEEHLTTNKALPNETLVSKKQEPLPQTTTRNQENNVSDDLMEAFMQFKNEQ